MCNALGARLAPNCPDKEKAFVDSTTGTVLGIIFDTMDMSWSISQSKVTTILQRIRPVMNGCPPGLQQLQSLLGALNDFA